MTDPHQRILHVNYKKLGLAAAIGLIIYVLFNFTTLFQSGMTQQEAYSLINEEQAQSSASAFASSQLGISESPETPAVSYRSASDLHGYLSREKLISEYDATYRDRFPYEMFRVTYVYTADGIDRSLMIDVNAKNGRVVAFNDLQSDYAAQLTDTNILPSSLEDPTLLREDKVRIAEPLLEELGLETNQLELISSESEEGLSYTSPSAKIGDSTLGVNVTFENDRVSSIRPGFSVPASYTAYVSQQTMWASIMTYGGYMLLTLVLGVLAIVYAFVLKRYTSFKRGIFLSLFYYVVSIFAVWNMRPYFEGMSSSDILFIVSLVLQIILGLFMAASLYFSLVAGDALWRSQGRNMWARRGEPAYGRHVWESAKTGYLWALILLAAQAIIFFVLERTLGVFSTSDDSQSTHNMMYPWLFPILAWMAGISEEAIYRFFGIPMLKKIVRSTVLASIITSLIWAFGHTLYPIYPVITRPIELLLLGLMFSLIFLRYGYITVMFSHVVFNSILMGLSLIFMGTLDHVIAGVVSIILPAIVGFVIYLIYRKDKPRPSAGGSPGGMRRDEHDPHRIQEETSSSQEPIQGPEDASRRTPGWSLGKDGRTDSV